MNKKLAIVLAAIFSISIICFLSLYFGQNKETSDTHFSEIHLASASDSADNMLKTVCGGNVSDTELTLQKSPFNIDFVPQEPNYVTRFENYSGDKAEFVPVLMYHFFYDAKTEKPTKGSNSHSIQSVEAQLKWLWENGYVTLTMDELYAWMQGEIELPAKCVLLTSDDGKDDFFTLLQPTLKKYGFVATSFVITSWRKNLPYKLTLSNIEMHSHTHNMHRGTIESGGIPDNRGMIQGVDIDEGVEDLTTSSKKLNGSKYIAYPYGTYGGNAKTIVKQAGYRLAFTTTNGVVTRDCDPYQLPRIRVSGSTSINNFKYLVRANLIM